MAKQIAGMLFEEAVDFALRDLKAFGRHKGVRTKTLARRMRWLGMGMTRDQIADKLHLNCNAPWARAYAYYIGGTDDYFDTFAWAIQEETPNG